MTAVSPRGWYDLVDPCSGTPYAVRAETSECVWGVAPAFLLDGFSQRFDAASRSFVFWHASSPSTMVTAPPVRHVPLLISESTSSGGGGSSSFAPSSSGASLSRPGNAPGRSFAPVSSSSVDSVSIVVPPSGSGSRAVLSSPHVERAATATSSASAGSGVSSASDPSLELSLPGSGSGSSSIAAAADKSARAGANPELCFDGYAGRAFTKGSHKAGKPLKFTAKQVGPLLQAVKDAGLAKEATSLFKDVQTICGDVKLSAKTTVGDIVRHTLMLCESVAPIRDECFMLVVRQTCSNPKPASLQKAWEFLVLCCQHFLPTSSLAPHLLDYLRLRLQGDIKELAPRAAAAALRQLKVTERRPPPPIGTPAELEQAMRNAFQGHVFGVPLADVMQQQAIFCPDLKVPAVVPCCLDAIRSLGGRAVQGIFRIPGDGDTVNYLKLHLESGELLPLPTADPKDVCSLLTMWLRELPEPIIPDRFYDACLELSKQGAEHCVALLEQLPEVNRLIIVAIIQLFQELAREFEVTKMNVANLALISAPNFLRCPNQNPAIMLQNAKPEIQFVSYLIEAL